MISILAFLNTYIAYIRWAVIAFAISASFWAGHHWASQACKAEKLEVVSAQLDHQTKTIEKVRYVQTNTAALPVGASARKLLKSWSRD